MERTVISQSVNQDYYSLESREVIHPLYSDAVEVICAIFSWDGIMLLIPAESRRLGALFVDWVCDEGDKDPELVLAVRLSPPAPLRKSASE